MLSPKVKGRVLQVPSPLTRDSSSTKPSSAHSLERPLFQRLCLTIASDALYLREITPGEPEQTAVALTASDNSHSVASQIWDNVSPSKTLRIAFPQTEPGTMSEDGVKKPVHRVELVSGAVPFEKAPHYVVHGCIGLLDLYTGPYLVVISAITDIGRIEDKPVYTIKKVAIVPLNYDGACEVLDKHGLAFDAFLDATLPPSTLRYDQPSSLSSSTLALPPPMPDRSHDETHKPTSTPTPRVKFALSESRKQDSERQHGSMGQSTSTSSMSMTVTSNDHTETRDHGTTILPAVSPPLSPRSPTAGLFSKFKMGFISQDGQEGKNLQQSVAANRASTPPSPRPSTRDDRAGALPSKHKQPSQTTAATETRRRISLDGLRNGRFAFGSNNRTTANKDTSSQQSSIISSPAASTMSDQSADQEPKADSTITATAPAPSSAPSTPPPPPRSSVNPISGSGLDVAEAFISNAARQLSSWSGEVVSGLLPSEKSEAEEAAEQELERNLSWDRKIIREIAIFFNSGFYFSYEMNLLSSMQKRAEIPKDAFSPPLWRQVDRRFWWNEHLQKELLEVNAEEFILPIMQGFVEIEQCEIEGQAFEFVVISRRSRERSGLRYQRRGIDAEGHAANFVETEQLLRIVRDSSDHQVSFVQIRGSIPLFWSQSPYNLKPLPILERTVEENENGFRRHFDDLLERYGQQVLVNLVEQHGREMIAGSAYTLYANKLNDPRIKYLAFDFHEECKGMKYENIDRLIKKLEATIQELGYCWQTSNNDLQANPHQHTLQFHLLHTQKGAIRTNCMDCLDRTNVVQSALARHVLNQQLLRLGISSFPEHGLSVHEHFETIFNNVWANNGDAISRAYAGTSALKGDFTRTGKRNLQGLVNDATNSIARMYQNTFKDFFRQAAIDYMLGVATIDVFKNLQTTAFGTAVVPPPILPPLSHTSSMPPTEMTSPKVGPLDPVSQDSVTSDSNISILSGADGTLLVGSQSMSDPSSVEQQYQVWAKIREAAIETAAEIVISPGEETWRGWTLICCSSEVSSALPSASSLPSSPNPGATSAALSASATAAAQGGKRLTESRSFSEVHYDEKVVLLTDRALYICTYDYEMEKVLEFWRLALEKLTAIDKGTFIVSTSTPGDLDPINNYGFAVVYRANVKGETLRVNTGSVRNRRAMTNGLLDAGAAGGISTLEPLLEEHDEQSQRHKQEVRSISPASTKDKKALTAASSREDEESIRSVRFKIVQHPETKYLPFVESSSLSSQGHDASKTTDDRTDLAVSSTKLATASAKKRPSPTAEDCVELIVKDIIQARCRLVRTNSPQSSPAADDMAAGTALLETGGQQRIHHRSPSEEYSASAVQVDLVVRDRILQDQDMAAKIEAHSMKQQQRIHQKQKKHQSFSALDIDTNQSKAKEQRKTEGGRKLLALLTSGASKRFASSASRSTDENNDGKKATTTGETTAIGGKEGGSKIKFGFGPFKLNKGSSSMVNLLGSNDSSGSCNKSQGHLPSSTTHNPEAPSPPSRN